MEGIVVGAEHIGSSPHEYADSDHFVSIEAYLITSLCSDISIERDDGRKSKRKAPDTRNLEDDENDDLNKKPKSSKRTKTEAAGFAHNHVEGILTIFCAAR